MYILLCLFLEPRAETNAGGSSAEELGVSQISKMPMMWWELLLVNYANPASKIGLAPQPEWG